MILNHFRTVIERIRSFVGIGGELQAPLMRTSITADTTVPIKSTLIPSQGPNVICTTVIITITRT